MLVHVHVHHIMAAVARSEKFKDSVEDASNCAAITSHDVIIYAHDRLIPMLRCD